MNRKIQLQLYQDYIINCTPNAKSVKNYTDFKRIDECLEILFPDKQEISLLDFDDPVDFEIVLDKLAQLPQFIDYNNTGKNQYSNTLTHYLRFLYAKRMFSKSANLLIVNDGLKDTYTIEEWANILKYYREQYRIDGLKNNACDVAFGIKYGKFLEKRGDTKEIANAASSDSDSDNTRDGYFIKVGVSTFQAIEKEKYGLSFWKHNKGVFCDKTNIGQPLQQIFYGAPGTGKSHEIKKLTNGESVIRTTFHPDSDYSTFVGAYKPTMENSEVRVVPVVVNNGNSLDQNNGTYWEKKIVYKFVKQAFLKAYLAAWKKMADAIITTNANTFTVGGNTFTLTAIDEDKVTYSSSFSLTKKSVQNVWNKLWRNGSFMIPTGQQSGESSEQAVCKWIYENTENCTKGSFDAGWDKLKNELATHSIDVDTGKGKADSKPKQIYTISLGDNDDTIQVTTNGNQKDKTRIKDCYSGESKPVGVEVGLVKILKELDPDSFENAWEKIKNKTNGTIAKVEPQFLIIEEINRGNCAQIFGDLFQLLDRQDNGFSEYPIEADTDLQQEIDRAFNEPGEYHLDNDIDIEGIVENYTSNYNSSLSEDIQHGRILLLPSNLYIWATMNTSDQSLFPIDSAFKRRWEWKYIKIAWPYKKNEDGSFKTDENGKKIHFNYSIEGGHDWWEFLEQINAIIDKMTNSADKQLGYFFAKAKDGIISYDTFVSKVCFYLWNDIFKTYALDEQQSDLFNYKDEEGQKKQLTFPAFYDGDGNVVPDVARQFIEHVMAWNTEGKKENS